ncbi:hypothetical protein [Spiroplasma sp. DGKH1]|uniref:hypothetical protein n=1 Tax=Spiroplasma sp. DGKH1 TaxID=3050074 RepID=UPI0034C5DA1A
MAVKRSMTTASLDVSDLIEQIIQDGKDLKTKEEVKAIKEQQAREEWIKKNNEACIAQQKKWEEKIAIAKAKSEKEALKEKEASKVDEAKIQLLEQKRKEEIAKNNALVEERAKKRAREYNISRVKSAMRDRKLVLSKESWAKESQRWYKLLEQVSK